MVRTTRSAFARKALRDPHKRLDEQELEEKGMLPAIGATRHRQASSMFQKGNQAWGDEAWSDP